MSYKPVRPYMFRLTTKQYNVAIQHSVVTKLTVCIPVRKSLDPPLTLHLKLCLMMRMVLGVCLVLNSYLPVQ